MLMRNTAKIVEMVEALDTGATLSAAAEFAGLRAATVKRWVQQGEKLLEHYDSSDDEPLFHERKLMELTLDVNRRMAQVEMRAAQTVMDAQQDGEWKAAAWILERRFKHNGWSARTEVTGADGEAIQVEDAEKRRARVEQALDELSARVGDVEEFKAEVIVEAEDDAA